MSLPHPTRQRLLEAGVGLLLKQGYNGLGLQGILAETGVPKGSFYHFFKDKESFALEVVDLYMAGVHQGLDACLGDGERAPLDRIRRFFQMTEAHYRTEGYMGCLLGGLGQELSGVSEAFRARIEACFSAIAQRLSGCLREARDRGDLSQAADPDQLAALLVDCWEGAALRSRLRRDPAPLGAMLAFYFQALGR